MVSIIHELIDDSQQIWAHPMNGRFCLPNTSFLKIGEIETYTEKEIGIIFSIFLSSVLSSIRSGVHCCRTNFQLVLTNLLNITLQIRFNLQQL